MSLEHGVYNNKILIMKIIGPTIGDKLNSCLHIHILKYYVVFKNDIVKQYSMPWKRSEYITIWKQKQVTNSF